MSGLSLPAKFGVSCCQTCSKGQGTNPWLSINQSYREGFVDSMGNVRREIIHRLAIWRITTKSLTSRCVWRKYQPSSQKTTEKELYSGDS